MKVLVKLSVLLLPLMLAVSGYAQRPAGQPIPTAAPTRPAGQQTPVSKMAVIVSDQFLDPKKGIFKFATLVTKLNGEFQKVKDDLNQMQQRAQALEAEISKLQSAPAGTPIDSKSIQAKSDQLDQLKKEIQRKAEDAQQAFTKRQGELFAPLQDEIGKALEVFAKAHNINLVIDAARVPIIYATDSMDITQAFINEFNSKNPVTAATTPPQ
jgi:outer membrane protein